MARRILLGNNKGGAGKSALVAAMAAALARLGYRVCVADLDPQGNVTRRMGYDVTQWPADRLHLPDALKLRRDRPVPLADIAVPCAWEHDLARMITLLPTIPLLPDLPMEIRQSEAGMENGAEYRLRRQLDAFDDDFDFTLIDVPPGLNHLFNMGLAAADAVLLVLQPEYDYVQGAVRAAMHVESEREILNRPDLAVIGVVVTNFDDNATHRAQMENLPGLFADGLIWEPVIPHRKTWSGANSDALPIELVKGWQAGELAVMFELHARRLLEAVGVPAPGPAPALPVQSSRRRRSEVSA